MLAGIYIDQMDPGKAILQLKPGITKDSSSKALFDTLHQSGGKEYLMAQAMREKKNYAKAEELFMIARNLKHQEASYHLGEMLINNVDKNRGIRVLEESAKEGYVPSMMLLAMKSAPWGPKEDQNTSRFHLYLNQVAASPHATEQQKSQAKAGLANAARIASRPVIAVGTVVSLKGVKKVVTLVQTDGFYVGGGEYVHAPGLKPTAYAPFTILTESNEAHRKKCPSCGGTGAHDRSVVSGTYSTTDVSYRTGSTISGDKKVTTITTHNNYKTVSDQCIVCSGKGYVF